MSLPKFAIGMIFVILAVVMWSVVDAASFGMIVLRAILCAIVLQLGYFGYVVAKVAVESRKVREADSSASVSPRKHRRAKDGLPFERPLSR